MEWESTPDPSGEMAGKYPTLIVSIESVASDNSKWVFPMPLESKEYFPSAEKIQLFNPYAAFFLVNNLPVLSSKMETVSDLSNEKMESHWSDSDIDIAGFVQNPG
jgi:hypothetical protein